MQADEQPSWEQFFSVPTPRDLEYVLDSWLAAYRTSPWAGAIPNNLYHSTYREAINQLLQRGARVLVVRNAANPELLLGWICFELTERKELVVHFAYVKPAYRRNGIYKALVGSLLKHSQQTRYFFTYRTPQSKYLTGCTFRPEISRRRKA